MRNKKWIKERRRCKKSHRLRKMMKCLCSEEQLEVTEMIPSSESVATKDYSTNVLSDLTDKVKQRPDTGNIEEAESSLREGGCLNYEEARALLGRYEYQKGNIEAALHVFEGIDVAAVTPKLKDSLARRGEPHKRRSQHCAAPSMSIRAVSLLLEAIYLKAKSLQSLGRFKEAAQSCHVILDIIESSLPASFPKNFDLECKMQETINKAVELLPELWKLADSSREAILSYRWALLHQWNLNLEIIAKIQKDFAIFLLYSGAETVPPNLRSQMDSSYVPRNNIEETILLLMILLRKVILKRIKWDPSILDHLVFALSIVGGLRTVASQVEELPPGIIDRKERYLILALCYYGEGDKMSALNLLKKILKREQSNPYCLPALLLASKICGEGSFSSEEGINFARKALDTLQCGGCNYMASVAHLFLSICLSGHSKSVVTESERVKIQSEVLQSLEKAGRLSIMSDPKVVYQLSLENADQRKLDAALHYAKCLLKMEGGANLESWTLMAKILSAQKQFVDAEIIINVALDQSGTWDQGELLRTKAKLQIAQGVLKNAIETYTHLLAVLQVQNKSFRTEKNRSKDDGNHNCIIEAEVWHDLALIYIKLSQWHNAEICLSKSEALMHHSATRWFIRGLLYEAKNEQKEAMRAFGQALDIDPTHVQSLLSMAVILRQLGNQCRPIVRSLLTEALRFDRMNTLAWYNLGLLYKEEGGGALAREAANCFEAAILLEESAPIEPFR